MRSQDEIQRAHDAIVSLILGDLPAKVEIHPDLRRIMNAQADVLCWVLEDDEQSEFGGNLDRLLAEFAKKGLVLAPVGRCG